MERGDVPLVYSAAMFDEVERRFRAVAPAVDFCSLRMVDERSELILMRQGVIDPISTRADMGAMVTVAHHGGLGYAATADLSAAGLGAAIARARTWAEKTAGASIFARTAEVLPHSQGSYRTRVDRAWESLSLGDKLDLLHEASAALKCHDRIVDWEAGLWRTRHETLYLTTAGGRVHQEIHILGPHLKATAGEGANTQTRSMRAYGESQQGGLEILDRIDYMTRAYELGQEALALLEAPNCPSGVMDVVLMPDQMMLQIHESIGHPLELDRILGDERNFAGTSFVTLNMFGSYQYGSELLTVTFDPEQPHELASYGFDDDGVPAKRAVLIENGILKRPLGSALSQARAGISEGVGNARACGWYRPPIDRMANLNLEPGSQSFAELIAGVERGVLMRTNRSWSIDDSRNKFQFGCELGQLIENGELKGLVKNPNYRGISATFWRNLTGVGEPCTVEVLGTPFCGKGEPSQVIRVGHASPPCRFTGVDVFGGE